MSFGEKPRGHADLPGQHLADVLGGHHSGLNGPILDDVHHDGLAVEVQADFELVGGHLQALGQRPLEGVRFWCYHLRLLNLP